MANPFFVLNVPSTNAVGTLDPADVTLYGDAEVGAWGHWLFGPDADSYYGLNGRQLTEQDAAPAFSTNYVSLPVANGDALLTGLNPITAGLTSWTFCGVLQRPAALAATVSLFGNIVGSQGSGLYLASGVRMAANYGGSNQTANSSMLLPDDEPVFVGVSMDWSTSINNLNFVLGGVGQSNHSKGTGSLAHRDAAFAVGNRDSASADANLVRFHEAMMFTSALTPAQMNAINTRSVTRMANRGVVIDGPV
ncbi:hypothetical protein [Pelagovum pacificum]|uniref:LamG domain-containing protein n=1 Tax=Pelagovum pacificum TaxID=2588711 RepID=A0A5C5GEH7_9RHOB|nr:hypothetical protein [Pelagovum pacificum]QQA43962.1 hypothetical protein I8N54_05120 [Pelagovum pacificum]TNY32910.1 hypothetical protein FHY64_06435 [Pelagovum pacificum]